MYHYSYPGSLQIIATQRNSVLWFPDMFFSAQSGSKRLQLSWCQKQTLLNTRRPPKGYRCLRNPPASYKHTNAHWKTTALKESADLEDPLGFHHRLLLHRFPHLERPEPLYRWVWAQLILIAVEEMKDCTGWYVLSLFFLPVFLESSATLHTVI